MKRLARWLYCLALSFRPRVDRVRVFVVIVDPDDAVVTKAARERMLFAQPRGDA